MFGAGVAVTCSRCSCALQELVGPDQRLSLSLVWFDCTKLHFFASLNESLCPV